MKINRTGCVYKDHSSKGHYKVGESYKVRFYNCYRTEIRYHGKRYRIRTHTRAEAEQWCADMARKFNEAE